MQDEQALQAFRRARWSVELVRGLRIVLLSGLMMGWVGVVWAVQKETSAEKAEHLREQANPQLFNDWVFDTDQIGAVPQGFSAVVTGGHNGEAWKVETQATAPSLPNVLLGTSGCAACNEILIAQGFQYEYPDLVVRIHQGVGAMSGQVGVVFGM